MRIMEKRCAMADDKSEQEIKPFLILAEAVMVRIKKLEKSLEVLLLKRNNGDGKENLRDSFSNADRSVWDDHHQFYADSYDIDDDDEKFKDLMEEIAKVRNKLYLWNLLSSDLLESMR